MLLKGELNLIANILKNAFPSKGFALFVNHNIYDCSILKEEE